MKIVLRKIHRWLGLLMALQIMAWMLSGLYFALFPIETIRGEHLTLESGKIEAAALQGMVPAWVAWNNVEVELGGEAHPANLAITARDGRNGFRIEGRADGVPFVRWVDGETGRVAPPLDAGQAADFALRHLSVPGDIERVEWVTEAAPGSEIRGRSLPLWRVSFSEPESLALYIEPWGREIVARRTTRWRVFDFLWMLHIMDFDERDDFSTPLLQGAATLGFLIALTGVVYWFLTTSLWRRRRRTA